MKKHDYDKYLDPINAQLDAMSALLEMWSNINSGSTNMAGLDQMLSAMQKEFARLGAEVETIPLPPQEYINSRGEKAKQPLGQAFRLRKRPQAKIQVFLGGHYDTVFPVTHPFQKVKRLDANTLNGPGVADLKGGLIVILKGLEILESSPYAANVGWEVLINPDEEIASPGSTPLFQEAAKRHHLGLIFEPSPADGSVAGKRGGSGNFTVVVRGKAAHVGRAHAEGRSAIKILSQIVLDLEALNGNVPGLTLNVGHIEGGGPLNVVPDLAIARFNIRNQTADHADEILKRLNSVVKKYDDQDGIRAELHGGITRLPKEVSAGIQRLFDLLNKCAQEEGFSLQMKSSGGVCDGNTLAAAGLANIDTMGVRGGAIHSDQEFVLVDSLVERTRLTARFLMQLGAGEITW